MELYLAIDLGTTGCRSILFDRALRQIASSYEEYGLITPREKWTEQDAELWWDMTLRTAKQAIAKSGESPKEIRGISISSQGITIVPVDRQLRPLCNALSWLDVRAERQIAQIRADYDAKTFFDLTGKPIEPDYTLPKLLWLREERPELWAKTWKLLMPMDFLIARLTGRCVTDHSMASGTMLYDIRRCAWSRELLERYGIDEELLPELCWSGDCAGTVLPEVAEALGLRPDCVVAVGAQDQKCAALGAGLTDGTVTISLGTAAAITKLWTQLRTEQCRAVSWCGYVRKGTWVTEGVVNTAATCLRWVRDLMFPGESYDTINREAEAAIRAGSSLMFYPYLNGPSSPDFYPGAVGCLYGMNLSTRRGDFAAAVMEGIAFQLRILLEAMGDVDIKRAVLFGGGAKSPLWCRIIADATGIELQVPSTEEAAGAGAAMLAAEACGEALPPLSCARSYAPSEERESCEARYQDYRRIEKKLWA